MSPRGAYIPVRKTDERTRKYTVGRQAGMQKTRENVIEGYRFKGVVRATFEQGPGGGREP